MKPGQEITLWIERKTRPAVIMEVFGELAGIAQVVGTNESYHFTKRTIDDITDYIADVRADAEPIGDDYGPDFERR